MKVKVMSRKEAEARQWHMGDYLISIFGDEGIPETLPHFVKRVGLSFADDDKSMTVEQATQVLWFAAMCDSETLYVHCKAGISRSAGVAESLHRLGVVEWDERDDKVWQPGHGKGPRYMPNAHVVSTILRAAGVTP